LAGNLEVAELGRRMFFEELSKLLHKRVSVASMDGRIYIGTLEGYNPENMDVCLVDARDEKGKTIPRLFLSGNVVAQIFIMEKPFDMKGLADRLERVFPKMVKLYDDIGIIVVMNRIRLDATGVIEGSGPMAERVQKVYEEFVKETKG
jgi:small nuclear ribonucleoprotein (snRNP)-like protein